MDVLIFCAIAILVLFIWAAISDAKQKREMKELEKEVAEKRRIEEKRLAELRKQREDQEKKRLEEEIGLYIARLPKFNKPIKIHFHWVEGNKRRDLDNVAFSKKFILDAMVKAGKLQDDNRRFVTAFTDTFSYGDTTKVILTIEELEE